MKWTIFRLKTDLGDKFILMNTLNLSIIEINKCEYEKIKPFINEKYHGYREIPDEKIRKYVRTLIEEEFVISDDINEKENFLNSLMYEVENSTSLILHILPTTTCNFACAYCYQDGIERIHDLTIDDVKIIEFELDAYLNKFEDIDYINVTLHGGEPTLNWNIVPYLMNMIRDVALKHHCTIGTSIVSNGYEFTPEKSEFLKYYGWYRFQVTLDGVKSVHDSRRKLKNGEGTFDRILYNVEYILGNVLLNTVDVRINYDKSNFDEVFAFLELLSRKEYRDKLNISLGYVTQTLPGAAHEYIASRQVKTNEHSDCHLRLYTYAKELGLNVRDVFVYGSLCSSKLKHSYIFSPDGYLYKCLSMVGREPGRVDCWRSNPDCLKNYSTLNLKLYDFCFENECPLIPLCHAECRFDAFIHLFDFNKIFCRKDSLIRLNQEMLKKNYLELTGGR